MLLLDDKGRFFGRVSLVDIGLTVVVLLMIGPALYFAWEIRTAAPYISGVDPSETIISSDKDVPLVVRGKWFDSQSVTRLDEFPLVTLAANSQRLDLLIPTQEIRPGVYLLTVTNRRGLSAKWKEPIRLLAEPPKIRGVYRIPFKNERRIGIIIFGERFDKKTKVHLGSLNLEVTQNDPQRLEAWGDIPLTMPPGNYPVQVTNRYGQSDRRDDVVLLSFSSSAAPAPAKPPVPASAEPPAPVVPAVPVQKISTKLVPVQVLCAFEEPEMKVKSKEIKQGAVTSMDDNTRPIAKIIRILGKRPGLKNNRGLIVADIVLACAQDLSSKQDVFLYGAGLRGYPPEGEIVSTGKRLPFQFRSLDIEGTVLIDPVLLDGDLKKYLEP